METLTVSQVASLLKLSTATVYNMVKKNEIPHKRVGRKIIFHRDSFEKWLSEPTCAALASEVN